MEEDKRIPPQSVRERKRRQGWIRKQLSRQMSWDFDFSGAHYPTAVAAAAHAVKTLEESSAKDQKVDSYAPEKSLNKMKSKVEDPRIRPERPRGSAKIRDEFAKASFKDQEIKVPISTSTGKTKHETGISNAPSMKKKASFVDTYQKDERTGRNSENSAVEMTQTFPDKNLDITAGSEKPEIRNPTPAAKPGPGDSMADAWENEEMASLRERNSWLLEYNERSFRYKKMMDTIEKWEIKKMTNAKRKIKRREAETDKSRMKTVQSYRNDISRIHEVAEAARAQAEKNRRNQEIKVKEKANKIRLTGKIPATCMCF
ncbi:ensconsin [Dorcoceras hygrometricum]|uniref:Ensconsin n=1 Tax=Dorcoceras hygrometricum TaxID=472368 RepID=A0A2Z7D5D3_9LAMI|nr:ensconsin [Dorcoceras hygrometricum]